MTCSFPRMCVHIVLSFISTVRVYFSFKVVVQHANFQDIRSFIDIFITICTERFWILYSLIYVTLKSSNFSLAGFSLKRFKSHSKRNICDVIVDDLLVIHIASYLYEGLGLYGISPV